MNQGRKTSGAKYHANRKKRLNELQGHQRHVVLGATKGKVIRGRGGATKKVLLSAQSANIVSKGKIQKTTIKNVVETPQNKFLARQNRLMKGAIIETDLGKARITNRPSQEGMVNAVLLAE